MRSLILAVQFLTRLPTPQVTAFTKDELATTAPWFSIVGLIVGLAVAGAAWLGARLDPWLGALLGLITWVWITGALHLDGLADLVDALGAAHRDPQRFLQVMRDPHVGSFGVIALVMQLISKLVLLQLIITHHQFNWFLLPLICAWSRLGAIAWSAWLPTLSSGTAEAFTWKSNSTMIFVSVTLLLIASLVAPSLVISPLVLFAWWMFLHFRLGGMTGDCLGAGIELTETTLLLITLCSPITIDLKVLL